MPRDGLAAERTALAWVRTILSVLAVVVITARIAADRMPAPSLILLCTAIAGAGLAFRHSYVRYRQRADAPADGRGPAALTGLVVLLGLLGTGLILLVER